MKKKEFPITKYDYLYATDTELKINDIIDFLTELDKRCEEIEKRNFYTVTSTKTDGYIFVTPTQPKQEQVAQEECKHEDEFGTKFLEYGGRKFIFCPWCGSKLNQMKEKI